MAKKNDKALNYEPVPGEDIRHAVRESIKLSKQSGRNVQFSFNHVTVKVASKSKVSQAVKFYYDESARQDEAYLNSP